MVVAEGQQDTSPDPQKDRKRIHHCCRCRTAGDPRLNVGAAPSVRQRPWRTRLPSTESSPIPRALIIPEDHARGGCAWRASVARQSGSPVPAPGAAACRSADDRVGSRHRPGGYPAAQHPGTRPCEWVPRHDSCSDEAFSRAARRFAMSSSCRNRTALRWNSLRSNTGIPDA